jgi:hypothetical protein
MTMESKIRLIAGTFILGLLFTAFIGANLIQSSMTRWCLMEDILRMTKIHTDG